MKNSSLFLSGLLLIGSPGVALATSLGGAVVLGENLTNPEPNSAYFGNIEKVLTVNYDTGSRPLVYLTGLNNTEDTKPFKFEPLHFDRLGAKINSGWVLKGSTIEIVNDDSIALDIVIVDGQGQQLLVTIPDKRHYELTANSQGNYEIFVRNHRNEKALLMVSTSHYVVKVGPDFTFAVDDLPPGNATVNLWFNGEVIASSTLEIPDDGNVTTCFFTGTDGTIVGDSCDNAKKYPKRR